MRRTGRSTASRPGARLERNRLGDGIFAPAANCPWRRISGIMARRRHRAATHAAAPYKGFPPRHERSRRAGRRARPLRHHPAAGLHLDGLFGAGGRAAPGERRGRQQPPAPLLLGNTGREPATGAGELRRADRALEPVRPSRCLRLSGRGGRTVARDARNQQGDAGFHPRGGRLAHDAGGGVHRRLRADARRRAGRAPGLRQLVSLLGLPEQFPQADANLLVADRLYVEDRRRITCSGGRASIDVGAAILARHVPPAAVQKALRILQVDEPGATTRRSRSRICPGPRRPAIPRSGAPSCSWSST